MRLLQIVAMRREGTKNYYYVSTDETQWKDIVELVNRVYTSVRHISHGEDNL